MKMNAVVFAVLVFAVAAGFLNAATSCPQAKATEQAYIGDYIAAFRLVASSGGRGYHGAFMMEPTGKLTATFKLTDDFTQTISAAKKPATVFVELIDATGAVRRKVAYHTLSQTKSFDVSMPKNAKDGEVFIVRYGVSGPTRWPAVDASGVYAGGLLGTSDNNLLPFVIYLGPTNANIVRYDQRYIDDNQHHDTYQVYQDAFITFFTNARKQRLPITALGETLGGGNIVTLAWLQLTNQRSDEEHGLRNALPEQAYRGPITTTEDLRTVYAGRGYYGMVITLTRYGIQSGALSCEGAEALYAEALLKAKNEASKYGVTATVDGTTKPADATIMGAFASDCDGSKQHSVSNANNMHLLVFSQDTQEVVAYDASDFGELKFTQVFKQVTPASGEKSNEETHSMLAGVSVLAARDVGGPHPHEISDGKSGIIQIAAPDGAKYNFVVTVYETLPWSAWSSSGNPENAVLVGFDWNAYASSTGISRITGIDKVLDLGK